MKRLAIIGTGGHARSVIDVVQEQGEYTISGLIDDFKDKYYQMLGYDILGKIDELESIIKKREIEYLFIAVGDNFQRKAIFEKVKDLEVKFATIIHPKSVISRNSHICHGTVVMAGAVVNSMCFVDKFCILNTNSSFDHDSSIGEFSSIAPNSATGGGVKIGNQSAICIGANVSNGITIGNNVVIGAGAVVVDNISDNKLAYGIPCKEIRVRQEDERYL